MVNTVDFINAASSLKSKSNISEADNIRNAIKGDRSRATGISLWPIPSGINEKDSGYDDINIFDKSRTDAISEMAMAISTQVQFPINTAFLHGIGVLASAMTKSFYYKCYGEKSPVTMYVISAQPPSTGKSGVNNAFVNPIRVAFGDYNQKQAKKRAKLEASISGLKQDIKKAGDSEVASIAVEIDKLSDKLEKTPIYRYSVSDATPEALEKMAFSQTGVFNMISDEATGINTLLGGAYSSDKSKSNAEIVLKGWDGDYLSSARITRDSSEGFVRGSIAVLAQDETINTILELAARGNGVSERFLIMREPNMLGHRDHSKFIPVPDSVKARYAMLISKIVHTEEFLFKFSQESMNLIAEMKNEIEPEMRDDGRYSNSLIRGVVGKIDKRVLKMSCVLHVSQHWNEHGGSDTIEAETVKWAIAINKQLLSAYEVTATYAGFVGADSECERVIECLIKTINKGNHSTTPSQIRSLVKNAPIFKARPKLALYIALNVVPKLEDMGYCCLVGKEIFINPRLRNM